jgi:hypothetical protein
MALALTILLGASALGGRVNLSALRFLRENTSFIATSGTEILEFLGMNSGDHTAFATDANLTPTPEPGNLTPLRRRVGGNRGHSPPTFELV